LEARGVGVCGFARGGNRTTSATKSWFQPRICIFPRVLSLSGCRVSSVIVNFRNQLRLLASVRSRVRLSSSRNAVR
jgi:hypothetical protein